MLHFYFNAKPLTLRLFKFSITLRYDTSSTTQACKPKFKISMYPYHQPHIQTTAVAVSPFHASHKIPSHLQKVNVTVFANKCKAKPQTIRRHITMTLST